MKSGNHSNALLVELLIVIMFFMLAATVLVQVFTTAEKQSRDSGQMIGTLNEAQNLTDQLYAADDPEAFLKDHGFILTGNTWSKADDDSKTTITVMISEKPTQAGAMRYFSVSFDNAAHENLITLNNAKYVEAAP